MSYPARWWSVVSMKSMFTFNFLLYYIPFLIINSFSSGDHIWEYKHKCQMSKRQRHVTCIPTLYQWSLLWLPLPPNEIPRVIFLVFNLETTTLHDTYGKQRNLLTVFVFYRSKYFFRHIRYIDIYVLSQIPSMPLGFNSASTLQQNGENKTNINCPPQIFTFCWPQENYNLQGSV